MGSTKYPVRATALSGGCRHGGVFLFCFGRFLGVGVLGRATPPQEAEQVDAAVHIVAVALLPHSAVLGDVDVAQTRSGEDALWQTRR